MARIAIVKPIKVRVGNLAGLRGVLNYIKADFKTKNGAFVFGKDCFPEKAFEQMAITKKAFNKDNGRQYAHFVQSFYRYDDLTPEQAMEIGQKFMARYERFEGFQVCAAVHTNGPQLHIHYVVNSVSHVDGHKWQSSREDLKRMRSLNDKLCHKYGLQVYEKQRGGHRSYGEYTSPNSWKKHLAEGIIQCIRDSNNLADFKLLLENRGVECDIGRKSILFTVQVSTYGLAEERKCSNIRLMSYGNFTSENILQSIQFNGFVLDTAWQDFSLVSEILGALGAIDHPDDPRVYERLFQEHLCPDDFKGKTKLQIEQMLAEQKFQGLLATQTKAIREKIAAEQAQSAMLHSSIAGLFDQFEQWLWEKKCKEEVRNYGQQITGDTKEAENDEDKYELY